MEQRHPKKAVPYLDQVTLGLSAAANGIFSDFVIPDTAYLHRRRGKTKLAVKMRNKEQRSSIHNSSVNLSLALVQY